MTHAPDIILGVFMVLASGLGSYFSARRTDGQLRRLVGEAVTAEVKPLEGRLEALELLAGVHRG